MKLTTIFIDSFYYFLVFLLFPVLIFKVLTKEKYRKYFWQRFGNIGFTKPLSEKVVWIHAVSVGEVIAAIPLVEELKIQLPKYQIIISATTKTGREIALQKFPELFSFQYPLDFSWAVKRSFSRIQPSMIILMELEVWPNFIIEAHRRNIPVAVANGRITEKSFNGYHKQAWFTKHLFSKIQLILTQNDKYANRFKRLNAQNVKVVGTMKYDNVKINQSNETKQKYTDLLKLSISEKVIVAGSTHPPEHNVVALAHKKLIENGHKIRLILAPRHPEKYSIVKSDLESLGCKFDLRSENLASHNLKHKILFLDTMGELAAFYSIASFAFIGGSLIPHGGQNMIEPAGLGAIPIFGKNVWNFEEPANELINADAAIMLETKTPEKKSKFYEINDWIIKASEELYTILIDLLSKEKKFLTMSNNAKTVVKNAKGAGKRSVNEIKKLFEE